MMIKGRSVKEMPIENGRTNQEVEADCSFGGSTYPHSMSTKTKSVPLNELLEKIPLAYSPVTKQLHIIYPKQELRNISIAACGASTEACCMTEDDPECEKLKDGLRPGSRSSSMNYNNDQLDDDMSNVSIQEATNPSEGDRSSMSSETSHQPEESLVDDSFKRKRRGISGFFSRGVFSWKNKEVPSVSNSPSTASPGWKLFSKSVFDHSILSTNEEVNTNACNTSQSVGSPASLRSTASSSKRYEDVVASSSALILHDRPANLPAKSIDEEAKHKLEYEQMVEAAKKKERQDAKVRKKQLQQQMKTEERLAYATKVWLNEVLPKWNSVLNCRKIRNLWWQGIPPCVRGKVWQLAIGNDLNVTPELYEICVTRAQELLKAVSNSSSCDSFGESDNPDRQASIELIQLDISRTFPQLCIFQKGGPYYDILHSLLGAYACYRPDIGYVQGMSFLAAILILNMEEAEAFVCFANLLNRPCHMAFFRLDQPVMQAYYLVFEQLIAENLPKTHTHFLKSHLTPDLYLLDWIYTVFAKAMPLDVACRVWDVYLRDGEEFLFRTALGVLHLYQELLLSFDFLGGAQFLTKLPEDLNADSLFLSIQGIRMTRYPDLLNMYRSTCGAASSGSYCSTTNSSGTNTPVELG